MRALRATEAEQLLSAHLRAPPAYERASACAPAEAYHGHKAQMALFIIYIVQISLPESGGTSLDKHAPAIGVPNEPSVSHGNTLLRTSPACALLATAVCAKHHTRVTTP